MVEISGLDELTTDDKVIGDFEKFKETLASIRKELDAGEVSISTVEKLKAMCGSLGNMGGNTQEAADMFKDVMGVLDKKAEELKLAASQENSTLSSDAAVAFSLRSELVEEGVEDLHKLADEKLNSLGLKEDKEEENRADVLGFKPEYLEDDNKGLAEDYVDTIIVDKSAEEEKKENEPKESSNEEQTEDKKEEKSDVENTQVAKNTPKEKSSEELIVEKMIKSGEFSEQAQNKLLEIAVSVEKDRKEGKLEGSSADAIVDRVIATEKGVFNRLEQAHILNYAVEAEKKENGIKDVKPEKRLSYDKDVDSKVKRLEKLKPYISADAWAALDVQKEDGKLSVKVPKEPHLVKEITQAIKTVKAIEKQVQMSMMAQRQQRA